jgi:hypothetical protein
MTFPPAARPAHPYHLRPARRGRAALHRGTNGRPFPIHTLRDDDDSLELKDQNEALEESRGPGAGQAPPWPATPSRLTAHGDAASLSPTKEEVA